MCVSSGSSTRSAVISSQAHFRQPINDAQTPYSTHSTHALRSPLSSVNSSDFFMSTFNLVQVRSACSVSVTRIDLLSSSSRCRFSRSLMARSWSCLNSSNRCKNWKHTCGKIWGRATETETQIAYSNAIKHMDWVCESVRSIDRSVLGAD